MYSEIKVKDTVIIVASGPSIKDVDLSKLRHADATIIAVNNSAKFLPWADYVFTLDTVHLRDLYDLPDFKGQRVAAVPKGYGTPKAEKECDRHEARKDTLYVERVPFDLEDQEGIMTGCSGFGAMQLAYKAGAKRVFVLGCDHTQQGDYFYGNNHAERLRPVAS